MISNEQAEKIYNDMTELFGALPNPIHEPRRTKMYLNMFKVHLTANNELKNYK